MRYLLFILSMGLFTLTGCDKDFALVDDTADQVAVRSEERPFKATGSGVDATAPGILSCVAPAFERSVEGGGNGTHVGAYHAFINECFDPVTFVGTGYAEITSPDGSMLHQDYEIQYYQKPGDPPNIIQGVFTYWSFDGTKSTGRFAGASGSGT